jgi:hypothetical protein
VLPGSALSVLLLFLLVVPGVLFELLSEHRRAAAIETTLREFGRVVLFSTVFTCSGFVLVIAVSALWPNVLPDPGRLLRTDGQNYLAEHYGRVLGAVAIEQIGALGTAWATNLVLNRRPGGGRMTRASAWFRVFRQSRPPHSIPFVRVELLNGDVYRGAVKYSSAEVAQADRELVLAPPLSIKRSGSDAPVNLPVEYSRVILRGSDIRAIVVAYGTGTVDPQLEVQKPGWLASVRRRMVDGGDGAAGQ